MINHNLIVEGAIFQEAQIVKNAPNKAIYRMTLQTMDEKNQNNRLYPKKVLTEGMKDCEERMKRRSFFGELDHPIPQNTGGDAIRQSTVLLKEVSHIIRDYEIRGNRVLGELETTDTPNGKILLGLLRDKVGLGVSMRGMAELDRGDDVNVVKGPLLIISYDSVSLPSHKSAVVNFEEMTFESLNVLQESSSCETVCTPDGKCYLANYFDKLVSEGIIKFLNKWR